MMQEKTITAANSALQLNTNFFRPNSIYRILEFILIVENYEDQLSAATSNL